MAGWSDENKPWMGGNPPEFTLFNVNIVDVKAGRIIRDKAVQVRSGLIAAIGPVEQMDSSGSPKVDLQNRYLCPGLIDCHVHLTATPGGRGLSDMFAASPNAIAYRAAYVAREMLLRGFTTVRDCGGADAALRDSIAEGLITGPRLFIAGKALSQTGGHGDFRASYQGDEVKCCGGHSPSLARICDGVPECLAAARDELRKGADFLKIMVGGGVATPTDGLDMLQFTAEEIQAITTTAANSNTYVTAHAYTPGAIRHAVDNGVRGIEHGNFIDAETAKYCQERGVVVTPTLITYEAMSLPAFKGFLDESSKEKNQKVLASGVEALKTLRDAGVTICYGSDLLAGMHQYQTTEFCIRTDALSRLEVLRSATLYPAKYLGMEGKLGVIAERAFADLLVLESNPLEHLGEQEVSHEFIDAIIKDGRVVTSKLSSLPADRLYDPHHIQHAHGCC